VSSSPAGPDFSPAGFVGCYRHPERMTGISCQRCHRPICGECMQPASVGFQCPRCVGRDRATTRQPRTRYGASLRTGGGSATKVVMAVLAVVSVLDLVSRGLATNLLAMSNPGVAGGQFWRLVTASLTSGSLIGLLMNLLVLWLVGRAIEGELGAWRFAALYVIAGLGGCTLFFLLGPVFGAALGSSAAVVGLLAANAVGKLKNREDVRPDIGLFVLLVLYAVLVGFASFGWLTLLGGIAVGALVGWVLAYAPRGNRGTVQAVGLLAITVVCLAAVVARLTLG
jgi:membrane associated rhomboid family serine protease